MKKITVFPKSSTVHNAFENTGGILTMNELYKRLHAIQKLWMSHSVLRDTMRPYEIF